MAAVLLFVAAGTHAARALASITLSVSANVSFPSANPNTTPVINGTGPVTATIFIVNPQREDITLTVQANGPTLVSGTDSIAIGNVGWNVGSAIWVHSIPPKNMAFWNPGNGPRALSTSPVTVITGNDGRAMTNADTVTGTVTNLFTFQNSWLYSTGTYTQTILWTLTAI
ncbi:MAG TPA: hypothetical protein VJA66_06355 [Thermoanaerobaculia bacterium]